MKKVLWWLHQWVRWTPLYECVCGYQAPTHIHQLWHWLRTRRTALVHEIT